MIEEIEQMDNKLHQAYALSYLINNKKVSKNFKSKYIKMYESLLNELPIYYNTNSYNINIKTFFNNTETTNNIQPTLISTQDNITFNLIINFMIKNKHIIEDIFEHLYIEDNQDNIKQIKAIISNKIDMYEFKTYTNVQSVIVTNELLYKHGFIKKSYKDTVNFVLPNAEITNDINIYPLVFVDIIIDNNILKCKIFSEENINIIPHFTIPKNKVKRYLF